MFISSGNRARHAYVEQAIGGLQDALQGETNRIVLEPQIAAFDDIAASLFVPNVRHDAICFPRRLVDSERVPVVAIQPGQEMVAPGFSLTFTPGQLAVARTIAETWGSMPEQARKSVDMLKQVMSHVIMAEERFSLDACRSPETANAFVGRRGGTLPHGSPLDIPVSNTFGFYGRPFVFLRYNKPATVQSPATMAHELTHVKQYLERPLEASPGNYEQHIRDELEANHMGASLAGAGIVKSLIMGVTEGHNLVDVGQTLIETIRQRHNPFGSEDPYKLSEALLAELRKNGLFLDIPIPPGP